MDRRIVAGLVVASAGAAAAPARARAQEAVITGRVTSDRGGQPVSGATVAIPELGVGGLTNAVGAYTLSVPAARVRGQSVTLVARFIGFVPQRRTVTLSAGRQTQAFTLVTDANRLTEVVVTGVTTATEQVKTPFTVQRVDSSQMPVVGTSAISQLQGKVPGASIVSASGRPGAAPNVVMRGPTSINAQGRSQQPLYIVDGVYLNGGIEQVNPNDIESVEVVKGAAAANLYGERAGSGVINITTKSGRTARDGVRFNVRAEGGVGDIPREFSIARNHILGQDPTAQYICAARTTNGSSCTQLVNLEAEVRRVNEVSTPFALTPTPLLGDFGIGSPASYGYLTGQFQTGQYNTTRNVLREFVTANGFGNTNVDVRGKVGNTGIYGSVSNLTNQGSIRYLGGYNRNSARANIDQRFGDRLSLTLQSFYSTQRSRGDNQDANTGLVVNGANAFFRITRTPSFADLTQRDQLGRLYVRTNPLAQGEQNANPLYDIDNNQQVFKGTRFLGGSTLKYDPFEWATLEGNFSYDRQNGDYVLLNDLGYRTTLPNPAASNGGIAQFQGDDESINTSLTATLRHTFFGDLRAALSGRYIYEQQYTTSQNASGGQLVVPNLLTADAVLDQNSKVVGSASQTVRGIAYIASTQLDFKDRYLVQANVRRGSSSLFGANNRTAYFPGVSGSWIVSREPWWPAGNALSLLKLRGAYGETGNRPSFFAQYATYNIGAGGLLTPNTLGNPDLRVERRRETETGLELEFFRRVGLNLTYALSNTTDQILPVPLALGTGFATQWQNAGTLRNGSLEASLDVPIVRRTNFTWSGRAIYTRLRSRITELNRAPFFTGFGAGAGALQGAENVYRIAKGEEFGTIYGRDFVRSCSQLPANFQSQCSNNGGDVNAAYRRNNEGYVVWVGQGNQLTEGVTRNLWRARLPGSRGPWGDVTGGGYTLNWGMPILVRDSTGSPVNVALGSSLPRYQVGLTQNVRYKKLSAYGLLDASVGSKIYNQGYAWSLGDFMTGANDVAVGASVEDAKPIGYYWRAGPGTGGNANGVGGFYDVLQPNRYNVEDGSFAKLRELSLTYNVGRLGPLRGNWTAGVIGRNLFVLTRGYRGFDPEVGVSGGTLNNAALAGVDRFVYPNQRTYTLQLQTTF